MTTNTKKSVEIVPISFNPYDMGEKLTVNPREDNIIQIPFQKEAVEVCLNIGNVSYVLTDLNGNIKLRKYEAGYGKTLYDSEM